MSQIACLTLGVTYPGGTVALDDASLTFEPGTITALLGQSGAGKSTLLRCLNGLVPASEGEVLIDGVALGSSRRQLRDARRRIGMVFQLHQLIGRLPAVDNVLMGRLAHHGSWRTLLPFPRRDAEFALHCLDRVGLLAEAWKRCDQLSGGQRQRVAIARALCQQPAVILADEPVASLDPATAERVMELLHRISSEDQLTTIMSLHQVDIATRFAQRIVGLQGGRVVFDRPSGELNNEFLDRIYHHDPQAHRASVTRPSVPHHEEALR